MTPDRTEAAAQVVESALRGELLTHWPKSGEPPFYHTQRSCTTACGLYISVSQIRHRTSWVMCPLCRLAAGFPEIT